MLVGLAAEEKAILEWAAFGNVEDAPSACPDFRITKISPALRANLQSVRPCACYETAESFSATAVVDPEAFSCAVCGWKLQAAPQHWRNDTALLFKYGTEGSLQDRFPDSAALRSALSSALDEAGEVRPHCQALVDAIHSLDWDKFYAKYLIVYQSEAVLKDRQLVLNISRFSAYADYQNPVQMNWKQEEGDFRFQTTGLRLVLQDGAVQSLESESELLLGRLFGSPCGGNGNVGERGLVLDGRFFDGVQRFSLRDARRFRLTGSALERVDIESVLCTVDEASVRFLLVGQMHFLAMESDLFSYGGTAEDCGLRG